jgi:hypothetical protein
VGYFQDNFKTYLDGQGVILTQKAQTLNDEIEVIKGLIKEYVFQWNFSSCWRFKEFYHVVWINRYPGCTIDIYDFK